MILKKCAVINDLSGYGKCSLGVAIPIISVMGSEVHPFPTAILSNQTAYESYMQVDFTDYMKSYSDEWKKLNASFDAILTGFVTNQKQLDIISSLIDDFRSDNTLLIVDPVMADNGMLYKGYTSDMCDKIKALCYKADIITPNIAELAFIADMPYSEDFNDICAYAKKLNDKGIENIVVTGCKSGDKISNIVSDCKGITVHTSELIGGYFSGTGDILASVITGGILRGMSLNDAVELATRFISTTIRETNTINTNEGIEFEKFLGQLL